VDIPQELLADLKTFSFSTGVLLVLFAVVFVIQRQLASLYANRPGQQYRQLGMVFVWLLVLVLGVVLMPISDQTQGQVLGFIGILLSATIALSSTTLVGNALAGLMLKALKDCRPGDYISVCDHAGRVASMDLLHVEIQTELHDLITLPNLYLVTNPMRVLRSSGTVLHVDVSLGYEIPRRQVEEALLAAAHATGLNKPFVQIREFGDFSVKYEVAGLLTTIDQLIDMRRQLRANVIDALQAAEIEFGSPTSMNTPNLNAAAQAVPEAEPQPQTQTQTQPQPAGSPVANDSDGPDAVSFDRAEEAGKLDDLKKEYTEMSQHLIDIEQELKNEAPGESRQKISLAKKKLEARMLRAEKEISRLGAKQNN